PVAIWISGATMLSIPWALAATEARIQYLWRAPLALAATVLPPLGIIGLASPLTASGYLFPGTAWIGLAVIALLPGIALALPALSIPHWRGVLCSVITACVALATVPRLFGFIETAPPSGWIAVNSTLGDVSQPFHDFAAAQFIHQTAANSPARVLI